MKFLYESGSKFPKQQQDNILLRDIPERYRDIKIDSFTVNRQNKETLNWIRNYGLNFGENKENSVFIQGGIGTGKTMMACFY